MSNDTSSETHAATEADCAFIILFGRHRTVLTIAVANREGLDGSCGFVLIHIFCIYDGDTLHGRKDGYSLQGSIGVTYVYVISGYVQSRLDGQSTPWYPRVSLRADGTHLVVWAEEAAMYFQLVCYFGGCARGTKS